MNNQSRGKNRGIFCGKVISKLEFSHEITKRKTNEVMERFYRFYIKTETLNKNKEVISTSELPIIVSEKKLAEFEPHIPNVQDKLTLGEIVFIKGPWRTHNTYKEEGKLHVEQYAFAKVIEKHEDYPTNTRNKFEFEGVLVSKLAEIERDERGKIKFGENRKPIPVVDENGKLKAGVRINSEGKITNDYRIAINRVFDEGKEESHNQKKVISSDYIHALSFNGLAQFVADKIAIGSKIKGSGYFRSRTYEKNGKTGVAYEAVITQIEKLSDPEPKSE